MRFFLIALCLMALNWTAQAHDFTIGPLTIDHPWARPSVTANGAVFFLVRNEGSEADRLIAASSPMAERVEIHTIERDGTIARMRQIENLIIPAGGEALLSPQADHVMLLGLKDALDVGVSFPITLIFEKAGSINVRVKVESLNYSSDDAHDHH